jgi:hypothetical protein
MKFTLTEWQLEAWAVVPAILLTEYTAEDGGDAQEMIGAEIAAWSDEQCRAFLLEVREVAMRHLGIELGE